MNLGQQIHVFNSIEVQDALADSLIELLKQTCEAVKASISLVLANMIHYQYHQQRKKELIECMVNTFALGNSFVLRKAFITFCSQAIQVLSFRKFREYFLENYLELANDPIT